MKMRGQHGAVPEIVAVDLAAGGEARMEAFRRAADLHDPEFRREGGIERGQPAIRVAHPAESAKLVPGELEVNGLPERMDPGVGPPGAVEDHSLADNGGDDVFERILHGVSSALALPPTESGAVIGDLEAEFHQESRGSFRMLELGLGIEPIL